VVPSYCERLGPGRFRLIVEPPLDPASFSTAAELHQAIAASAERYVRSHLDQWCIFRPLWTTPAGEESEAPVGEEVRVGA
jgi:lauroyl/myristoyl acyltransferase